MKQLSAVRIAAMAMAVSVGGVAVNCSKTSSGRTSTGTISLAFTLQSGALISHVTYDIKAGAPSGIPDVTGEIYTSDQDSTASFSTFFPASTGDTVALNATTSAGVSCHGVSLPFDVAAGATTRVAVTLICAAPASPDPGGAVIVNATAVEGNACPYLTSWVASPLQTSVGGTIDMGATAADRSTPPDTITFAWSPAANFTSPTAATTQYHCTTSGTHTITVTVSDNHGSSPCSVAVQIDVICGSDSGGSAGASGSGGTQLDSQACVACEANATADGTCFNTSVDGIVVGCDGFSGAKRDACYALLRCIRTGNGSGQTCADLDDPTPCLCGNLIASDCGRADPTTLPGVCRAQYLAASSFGGTVFSDFFAIDSPAGIANNLFSCDIDMAFDSTLSCPSSICGVQTGNHAGSGGTSGSSGTGGSTGAGGVAGAGGMAGGGSGGNVATGGHGGPGGGPPPDCTTCETLATADGTCFNTSVDGVTNGCDGFFGAQRDACIALMTCIRTGNGTGHTCASGDDPRPCLCGALTITACAGSGPTTLPGVCRPQYIAANGGTGTGLFGAFFGTTSPVGIANNLFICDVDMAADPGLSCPSNVCGVQTGNQGVGGGTGAASGAGGAAGTGGVAGAGGAAEGGSGGGIAMGGQGGAAGGSPSDCTTCETLATADGTCFNTSTDGVSNGCDGFTGAQRDACVALVACIRTGNGMGHSCANGDDPIPCLCGGITAGVCSEQDPTTLPGVCRPQYIAANGGTGIGIYSAFFATSSPIGIANNLFTCDFDMASDTTLSCPSSICGVQ
ncbi:MAG TPA: hypothetical protein VHO67_02930 [Polyangia bacterium]|nr:hypothetical protein [Polyangia bacterium]